MRKRLLRLDDAFAVVRHITAPWCKDFIVELEDVLKDYDATEQRKAEEASPAEQAARAAQEPPPPTQDFSQAQAHSVPDDNPKPSA